MSALPNVPTFTELGYPQIDDIAWIGLWTTPDVPADIQAKVREATLKALQQPKVAERFKELGGRDVGLLLTPEQLSQSLRVASDKHGANLKAIGFEPEYEPAEGRTEESKACINRKPSSSAAPSPVRSTHRRCRRTCR